MIARLFTRWSARHLGKRSHHLSRKRIVERAIQMRRELKLPPDPRLA